MSLSIKAANLNTSIKESAINFAVRAAKFCCKKTKYLENDAKRHDSPTVMRTIYAAFLRSDIFIDCITVFLLSGAISLTFMLLPLFYAGISTGQALGFIGLSIIAFTILRLRWWLAPLLIVIAVGSFGLYHYLNETLAETLSHWAEFSVWYFSGAPEHEIFSPGTEQFYFSYFMIFLITLAVFFIIRRFFSICLLIFAFITTGIFAGGFYELHIPIPLFIVGIIILLPRTYSRLSKKRGKSQCERSHLQLFAIPVAIPAVLLSLVIFPPSSTYFRWRPLANTISDIGHLINPAHAYKTGSFDIYTLGFGASPERLGGPVVLSDGYILTVVSSKPDVPILLSGTVMDYYTGYRWLPGENDGSLRFNSRLWRENRLNSFDFNMPIGDDLAHDAFYAITSYVRMDITYAAEFYTTIFSHSGMRGISFASSALNSDIRFNQRSELYMPSPIPTGEIITIHARVINRNAPLFYENILKLEGAVGTDPRYLAIVERYTTLPESLPDIVRETALYVVGDETSPFKKATALATWLGENFHYTLEPVMPPEDMDFVAHFLETREGYCTYYATAMAVMARTLGLPSRYVTGFALFRNPIQRDVFYATGRTVHAWAEIYFYGIGWIPFDPLDWNPDTPLHMPFAFEGAYMGLYWWDDYMAWGGIGDFFDRYGEFFNLNELQQSSLRPGTIVAMVAGFLLAAALLIFIFLYVGKRRKYQLRRKLQKFSDLTGRFSFYYAGIVEHLRVMGLGMHPGETLIKYNIRIKSQIEEHGLSDSHLGAITNTQMHLHFANISPTATDVSTAEEFHTALKEKLQSKFSAQSYLRHKTIWKRS